MPKEEKGSKKGQNTVGRKMGVVVRRKVEGVQTGGAHRRKGTSDRASSKSTKASRRKSPVPPCLGGKQGTLLGSRTNKKPAGRGGKKGVRFQKRWVETQREKGTGKAGRGSQEKKNRRRQDTRGGNRPDQARKSQERKGPKQDDSGGTTPNERSRLKE